MTKLFLGRGVRIFEFLDESQKDAIARLASERKIYRNEVLFKQGDPAESLFLLEEGQICLKEEDPQGQELSTILLEGTSAFGEIPFVDRLPRETTALVKEDGMVNQVLYEDLERLIQSDPSLGYKINRSISYNLAERIRCNWAHLHRKTG